MKKLNFYISPQGLLTVRLAGDKAYSVSGVRAFPIRDISTKKTRHVLIFN